jgi:hypothetical protein
MLALPNTVNGPTEEAGNNNSLNQFCSNSRQFTKAAERRQQDAQTIDPRQELKEYLKGSLEVNTGTFNLLRWWKVCSIRLTPVFISWVNFSEGSLDSVNSRFSPPSLETTLQFRVVRSRHSCHQSTQIYISDQI